MLFVAALSFLMPARPHPPQQVIAHANRAVGHLGLTLIALVYVLVTVWQA